MHKKQKLSSYVKCWTRKKEVIITNWDGWLFPDTTVSHTHTKLKSFSQFYWNQNDYWFIFKKLYGIIDDAVASCTAEKHLFPKEKLFQRNIAPRYTSMVLFFSNKLSAEYFLYFSLNTQFLTKMKEMENEGVAKKSYKQKPEWITDWKPSLLWKVEREWEFWRYWKRGVERNRNLLRERERECEWSKMRWNRNQ